MGRGVYRNYYKEHMEKTKAEGGGGEGREKERERNINVWLPVKHLLPGTWPETQACALDWELNQ